MAATMTAIALISGCGGSSPTVQRSPALPDAYVDAAQSLPRAGSVTQSSNTDPDGVTTDRITATALQDSSGQPRYQVTNAPQGGTTIALDSDDSGTLVERETASGERFSRRGVLRTVDDDRAHFVLVDTDRSGQGDTDYLVGGVWITVQPSNADLDDPDLRLLTYAVFLDGGDPFNGNIQNLEGTATYLGTRGVAGYILEPDVSPDELSADVRLTAEFGGTNELGTIGGRIYNFRDGNQPNSPMTPGNPVLELVESDIGAGDSGFARGDTRLRFGGQAYTGKWGAQFFGNGHSSGHPGSVGGTFGAVSEDERIILIGYFGADKQ